MLSFEGVTERCAGCSKVLVDDGKVACLFDILWARRRPVQTQNTTRIHGQTVEVDGAPRIYSSPSVCSQACWSHVCSSEEWLPTPMPKGSRCVQLPIGRVTRVQPIVGGWVSYELGRTRDAGFDPPLADPSVVTTRLAGEPDITVRTMPELPVAS